MKHAFKETRYLADGRREIRYCSVGVVCEEMGLDPFQDPWAVTPEFKALNKATRQLSHLHSAAEFNDYPGTSFPQIERLFLKAIEIAGEDE